MTITKNYEDKMGYIQTERFIKLIKDNFEDALGKELNLIRVSAPLFLKENSGLNDNLNGYEKPIAFKTDEISETLEIVHSLAKWKRYALAKYGITSGGLYTDMNAIRKDEKVDALHSYYVDQWDFEMVISKEERNLETLKEVVRKIVHVLSQVEDMLHQEYKGLKKVVEEEVFFITSQELEDRYPNLSSEERQDLIAKEHHSVCVLKIGKKLKSGKRHDGRAPDYDDWELNGDILIYYPLLERAVEIASLGIRVDKESLQRQLLEAGEERRLLLPYHQMIMQKKLPLTLGGGIGQSRVCLLLLNKAHIGEVQASVWPDETLKFALENNLHLL